MTTVMPRLAARMGTIGTGTGRAPVYSIMER